MTPDEVAKVRAAGEEAMLVVYAPWCKFCMAMESEYSKLSAASGIPTYKFRGDEQRAYVEENLNTKSFRTVNFISSDGTVTKYESEKRSVEDFKAFIKSKSKSKVSA